MGDDEKARVLEHVYRQATAAEQAREIAEALSDGEFERGGEETTKNWIALANALLASGRITASEYVINATFSVEHLHQARWLAGDYPEIEELSWEIRSLEKSYGLKENEYWLRADEPEDVRLLNSKYEAALDKRFEDLLTEFGLQNLADLWRNNRQEYDRQREIGRRSIFEKHDHLTAINSSLKTYEDEAEKSANAGAFYAAAVMLGSAAEARLIEAFLSHPEKMASALAGMKRSDRPRNADPLHWNLEHLVAVAEQAGWIGKIEDEVVGADVRLWLLSLRSLRNLLHPGRHARDKPHAAIGREEYNDAQFGYAALCISLATNLPGN